MTDDFENRLRDMMRAQSTQAPDDYPVVQRVLHDTARRPATQPHNPKWRTWAVPLVAAGAVAAVAATVVGVENFRPSAHHTVGVGNTGTPTVTSQLPTQPDLTATHTTSPPSTPPNANALGLTNFRISDLTWVGTDGWALGSADCLKGVGSCIAMARTTDGTNWTSMAPPPANLADIGCATVCVEHVRFATDQIGYVYGSSAFFMTADGGRKWTADAGAVGNQTLALETLEGNVIRVQTTCLPGCDVTVSTAPLGSSQWTARTLPGTQPSMVSGATLVRVAGSAYLDVYGHIAGGAQNATSTLFISHDAGATWTNKGEPCPQTGGGAAGAEVDSTAIAAGGGSFAVLCTPRGTTTGIVYLSSDAGGSYRKAQSDVADTATGPIAVTGHTLLLSAADDLFRSTNQGDTWTGAHQPAFGGARWLGFESLNDARMVSHDGSTIWTTHDAGAHWSPTTFP